MKPMCGPATPPSTSRAPPLFPANQKPPHGDDAPRLAAAGPHVRQAISSHSTQLLTHPSLTLPQTNMATSKDVHQPPVPRVDLEPTTTTRAGPGTNNKMQQRQIRRHQRGQRPAHMRVCAPVEWRDG